MISVLEQPQLAGLEPPAKLPTARNKAPDVCAAVGIERNHDAPPPLHPLPAREADRRDMARLAAGDEQSLESLMQRHARTLLRHLERMVRNHSDAKELLNETFLRVFHHCHEFEGERPFSPWLHVIASHLASSLLRRRDRQPEHLPLSQAAAPDADALVDGAPSPLEQAASAEWTDALEEALARLPESTRRPLLLVALDGCSHAEAAARLGCTTKTIEMRLYHGRKRLRHELETILRPWPARVELALRCRKTPFSPPLGGL